MEKFKMMALDFDRFLQKGQIPWGLENAVIIVATSEMIHQSHTYLIRICWEKFSPLSDVESGILYLVSIDI